MGHLLFQTLVDAPSIELASAVGFQEKKAQDLQETLQRVLDRREEERQSKELLQLYLKAAEKEGGQQADQSRPGQEGTSVVVFFFTIWKLYVLQLPCFFQLFLHFIVNRIVVWRCVCVCV